MYLVKAIISDKDRAEKLGNTIILNNISKEFGINRHNKNYEVKSLSEADNNMFCHLRRFYPEVQVVEVRT